jgi:hypothetical protein
VLAGLSPHLDDLCWAVTCFGQGESVRIRAVDPAEV